MLLFGKSSRGSCEFLINSHGQWNNIDQAIFRNNEEIRKSLVNMSNINTVRGNNPYSLDCWTCDNGYGMKNNQTTTSLNGQCVVLYCLFDPLRHNADIP